MQKVKTRNLFASLVALGLMAAVPSAFADSGLLKACKGDLKKADCKPKTDAEVHECLEKHEAHGKKNDGFSSACYEAHESYEKKMGKEEKDHDESSEHKE